MTQAFQFTRNGAEAALVTRGQYRVRFAQTEADLRAAKALRYRCFIGTGEGLDEDPFDAVCDHVLVERVSDARLVGCFRLLALESGAGLAGCYAAQFYDLSPLKAYARPLIELGRFCLCPDHGDADVLRVAWGALAVLVDAHQVGMLFGCSSFAGTDPAQYRDGLGLLGARHVGPQDMRPGAKAAETVALGPPPQDPVAGVKSLPALLRTYLSMGGWVSDHAVIDRDLGTLHVFTGLEIDAIPASRAAALRSVAG